MNKPKRPRTESPSVLSGEQRINKLLAAAGLGSRRQVDELITDGRVEIDGKTITQVGVKVDVDTAKISVDGEPLKRHRPLYFAVHKPAGVLCTNSDPEGRPRVIDLVPGHNRLFPVGRLDSSSTGLILLTNDGELAQRLAHPRNSVPKSYYVVVAGQVEMDSMRRLQRGIYLAEGFARVDGAKIRRVRKGCTEIEITLSEGKNREIRRVLARLGHKVITLRRLAIGPLRLATMPEGSYRPLSQEEVAQLYNAVEEIKKEKKIQRKEKDRHRSAEMSGVGAEAQEDRLEVASKPDLGSPGKDKSQKVKKKSKRDDDLDTLPPLSVNPYSEPEDQDEEDSGFKDSVLVKNSGPSLDGNVRRGKVISYSDDDESSMEDASFDDDDEFDATGMGFESFDDDDDDDFGDMEEDAFEGSDDDEVNNEVIQSRSSARKKPQQPRGSDRNDRPARTSTRRVKSATGAVDLDGGAGFSRKKSAVGRPTGPNSGARGRNPAPRKGSSGGRKGAASSRFGASAGRPSSSRPSKGAARTGSGFGVTKTSGPREGFGGGASASRSNGGDSRSAGPRSAGPSSRSSSPARKKSGGGGRSFGAPKGKKSGGRGRSPGKR
ncbi:MAG: pseudouridine synthase [Planctomycetota bacterium]|nr:pseudouridine synthase [Planctomycetota bacterium]